MNKLHNLGEQASLIALRKSSNGTVPVRNYLYEEALGELILFECIKLAVFRGDKETAKAIKEHFGVEE
jgi:hypothetical protein